LPPSRTALSPKEQLRAARKLDDNDVRMIAYDSLVVQVIGVKEKHGGYSR
jgi:hypothetical protein